MTVEIREATPEEVDAVVDLWQLAAGPSALVDQADDIRRLLATGTSSVLLAYDDGAAVGSIIAGWDGWRGNLYRLAVLPERRNEGIARQLVQKAEKVLTERGCQRVNALVHLELADAAPFWTKVGYAHDTEVGRFVRNLG
ncbi:MAG: GNAT family N-acetyltransferase [Acidimicrobiia bacterium]|nr:GNAT family N-acetyltransferase [Acidimicrobiia bacterium]